LFGLDTIDHVLPFQDSISVSSELPTAIQLVELVQDTPSRKTIWALKLGLRTIDQAVPFKDSIRGLKLPLAKRLPTAMQLVEVAQDTPERLSLPSFGLGETDQLVPFHDSTRVPFL
jgi:hypothetical protein